ncbi:MAG TPA: cytochrome c3 family protein [Anaeromyxobacter sp.]|nr:cytochrome c3 family protein [Anaeromyxobacter sp.]
MKKLSALLLLLAGGTALAAGGTVLGSKHDLSVSGPGPIRALSETNACVFCHLPHSGVSSRPEITASHRPYESSTMKARPGAPTGATRICLSCHDGTIAVGQTKGRLIPTTVATIPAESPANLGTDLRRTHPVSFRPVRTDGTHLPPSGDLVRLDRSGQLQCTACHDPHAERGDPVRGKFLVKPSERSAICLSCHEASVVDPAGGTHSTSTASFGPDAGNTEGWTSVGEAGCMACHVSHGADPKGQLVPRPRDDDDALCLRCHGFGTVARQPIGRDLAKPYAHVSPTPGVHDAGEGLPSSSRRLPEVSPGAPRHVACVDCHDPHAAGDRPAIAPGVGGALTGVWGIDLNGQRVAQVRFEYEVCLKCHADSANQPQRAGPLPPETARRARIDANLRRVFATTAASAHPVLTTGRNPSVPSLRAPLTPASIISCGDCHASDTGPGAFASGPTASAAAPGVAGVGARGPHGSIYPHLLERSYATADNTPESPAAYALCYKCHDRDKLLSAQSTFSAGTTALHGLHAGVTVNAPCSACHNAHGISATSGSPQTNAHLIDFDVSIVKPGSAGIIGYQALGPGSGSCTLSCHGKDHAALAYSPGTAVLPALRGATQRRR